MASKSYTIAFAESATAGRMCSEFSLSPHSGTIQKVGIVSYDVPHHLIETYTSESAQVTQSMAEHSLSFFKSDAIVAITGLTTAGGSETTEKPAFKTSIILNAPSFELTEVEYVREFIIHY